MTTPEETYWEKANKTKMGTYITDMEMTFLFSSVNSLKCGLVADLGAGAGRFSIPLAKNNTNVAAIDISLHGLKRLKYKNKDVNTVLGDVKAIPLRDNMFDAIVMIELLDCVLELEYVLTECWRILKPEGLIVFSFGNESSLKGKLKGLFKKPYLHSYQEVLRYLDSIGFRIVRKEGFNWLPFNRSSDNPLIPLFAKIEGLLGPRKPISISPWVMMHAIKSTKR